MDPPTTLQELAQQQHESLTAQLAAARINLTAARDALLGVPGDPENEGALAAHQLATDQLAELQRSIDATRRDLATAVMPSDIEALAEQLRQLIAQQRSQRQVLLAAQRDLSAAESALEVSQSELQALTEQLAVAQADLSSENDRAAKLAGWRDAVVAEPLASLRATATEVLAVGAAPEGDELSESEQAQAEFATARDLVSANVPAPLLVRAQERRADVIEGLTIDETILGKANTLLDQELTEHYGRGVVEQVEDEGQAFETAEAALGAYVRQAREAFEVARATLRKVSSGGELTDAESARITALATYGEPAVVLERARDVARHDLLLARANLEQKRLEVLAEDIDQDFDAADGVAALQAAVAAAEAGLEAAQTAYGDDDQAALEAWESAIPESAWGQLVDFERARELLQQLSDTDPAALVTALGVAEATAIQGRLSLAKRIRELEFLRGEVNRRVAARAQADATRQTLLVSGIRGEEVGDDS